VLTNLWMQILPHCKSKLGSRMKPPGASWAARIFALLAAALAAAVACSQSTAPARHVVVISVDGMGASWYRSPSPDLQITNILRLKNQGSFAEGVGGIYPTVTYPSHTTIVTGRLSAEHGIYTNVSAREPGEHINDWFWFSKSIKVPTLWDEARRAGLKTAAVGWPVTAGAPIDWDLPEIWDPAKFEAMDLGLIAKYSTPGLIQEVIAALHPTPDTDGDNLRADVAAYLLKKYQPNLLLLHLNDLDHTEHGSGPASVEARKALEESDVRIGRILEALKQAELSETTDVFIVSDHGFLQVEKSINPNVLLAKAGLLKLDEKGNVTGGKIFTLSNGGSFFLYWPNGRDLRAQVNAALKPLLDQGLLWAVFDRAALDDLGVEPAVQLALEPPTGYMFGSRATGEVVSIFKKPGGTHGFFPYRKGLESAFIASGPHIRSGIDLHRITMTAIAPTILKVMGIEDAKFGDTPALEDVLK
jgi:predicted AlkP superfamily pyrophosphatase or phosphodiesterase